MKIYVPQDDKIKKTDESKKKSESCNEESKKILESYGLSDNARILME